MAKARQKTTRTVQGAKLTVYKMGKRWRWMLMREKKIVSGGSTESESSAIRDGKAAAGVRKKPKKAAKRKTAKRKTTRKKAVARRPTKKRVAKKKARAKPKSKRGRPNGTAGSKRPAPKTRLGNGAKAAGKAATAEDVAKLGGDALGSGAAANGHRGRGRKGAAKPLDKGQREKQARSALSAALRRDK